MSENKQIILHFKAICMKIGGSFGLPIWNDCCNEMACNLGILLCKFSAFTSLPFRRNAYPLSNLTMHSKSNRLSVGEESTLFRKAGRNKVRCVNTWLIAFHCKKKNKQANKPNAPLQWILLTAFALNDNALGVWSIDPSMSFAVCVDDDSPKNIEHIWSMHMHHM